MDDRAMQGKAAEPPKEVLFRDVTIFVFAAIAVVLANVGVVHALDIALDAFYR